MVVSQKLKKLKKLAVLRARLTLRSNTSMKPEEYVDEVPAKYFEHPNFKSDTYDNECAFEGLEEAHGDHNYKVRTAKRKRGYRKPNESDDPHTTEDAFCSLDIDPLITEWLRTKNITKMTRVQRLVLPGFLNTRKDMIVQSQTGSGKTLCFVIPMLDSYLKEANKRRDSSIASVYSVIMLPTRELATQVHSVVIDAIDYMATENDGDMSIRKMPKSFFSCIVLIGGSAVDQNIRTITKLKEGVNARPFVIATPGRLRHLMDKLQQAMIWTFRDVAMLVLDEADRLLEMGYQNDMTTIMGNIPKQRKTGFFSATLPADVIDFAKKVLRDYEYINADSDRKGVTTVTDKQETTSKTEYATPTSLENYYLVLDPREKLHFVVMFLLRLRDSGIRKCAIFFLTCDIVDYFSLMLDVLLRGTTDGGVKGPKILLYKIHRKMPTNKRQRSLNSFRGTPTDDKAKEKEKNTDNSLQVLLCTDVFSRGIDIPQIEWVIQFDAPQDPNFFLHRIGRVSRAGASGKALLLLNTNEEAYVQFQLNRKIPLKLLDKEDMDAVQGYYQLPQDVRTVLPHDGCKGHTTVENGKPYICYLESTEPEVPLLPWKKTCEMLSYVRSQTTADRSYLLAASKAFVSFTRAYSEHRLSSIFEEKKLDYGALATSLGVLRVPRVKEILGRKLSNFASSDTDPQTVPFKDEAQESARIRKLEEDRNKKKELPKKKDPEPAKKPQRTRTEKRQAKRESKIKEWEELSREEWLAKRLKRGKITKQEYERMLRGQNSSEESDNSDDSGSEPEQSQRKEEESDWEAELDNFVKECQQNSGFNRRTKC